jgi:hypothetical protein
MNTTHLQDQEGDRFLNLVDFKWLMAGMGWWVDLSRLESEKAYRDECLQRALKSDSELLHKHSAEMLGLPRSSDAHCDTAAQSSDGRGGDSRGSTADGPRGSGD